jgi:CO/xanthine dehydrogenase Mo-binding subunit
MPGVGAALVAAIFAATRERIRSLPVFQANPALEPAMGA